MKALLKRLAAAQGLRISRLGPAHRFQAMDDALCLLAAAGYRPERAIDAGANVGDWSRLLVRIFPDVQVHLIEPQPGCRTKLEELVRLHPGWQMSAVALSAPGVRQVQMEGGGLAGRGTGNYVVTGAATLADAFTVSAATLDELLAGWLTRAQRPLLKLDLQGHEATALAGAGRTLEACEVVVCEASLYPFAPHAGRLLELLNWFRERDFVLHDLASLSGRTRDQRARECDLVLVRRDSPLLADCAWE